MKFTEADIESWRRQGAVMLPRFFNEAEVAAVAEDFPRVFPNRQGAASPMVKTGEGSMGAFHDAQFRNFENIPFKCSPALNLVGVHPDLVAMARAALGTPDVQLYQNQAWAKFTGEADFEQPFHCDFGNHTLTVPAESEAQNSITFLIYFTDVSEAHGPTHYVTKPDAVALGIPATSFDDVPDAQQKLRTKARSAASPAGSVFAYGIDVFHRGTNLTAPYGYRYAVTACYKRAGNESIGYMAWPYHQDKPWHLLFAHATPDQLGCFGVPLPGAEFWNESTISATQRRYPGWNPSPYLEALELGSG